MSPEIENQRHLTQEDGVHPTWKEQHGTKHITNAIDTALNLIMEMKQTQTRRKM